jgi:DNA-binding SARP family transcriptional activator
MIEFRLLGSIDLIQKGTDVDALLGQPKRLALLAYLATPSSNGFHRRDTLLFLFWPELDDAHARAALRNALSHLRRTLSDRVILTRGDEVGIARSELWSDAAAFEEALVAGDWFQVDALYRGDFLHGFHVPDAPGFEHWMEAERARLRRWAAEAARTLTERAAAESGACPKTLTLARRAVALSPECESARRTLIALLNAGGDRAGALSAYEQFARWLQTELDAEPGPTTQALVDSIRRDTTTRAPAGPLLARPAAAQPTPAPSSEPQTLPPRLRQRMAMVPLLAVAGALAVTVGGGWFFARNRVSAIQAAGSGTDGPQQ